jgi:hypothetical protein
MDAQTDAKPRALLGITNLTPLGVAAAAAAALAAVITGFWLDAQAELQQPMLFWPFVIFGLAGTTLGLGFGMRNDPHVGRNLLASFGALLAWRFSYFPFMVVAGWKGTLGEAVFHELAGISVVYPFFIFFLFAQNLAIGAVAAAAIANPQGEALPGRFINLRKLLHKPPRMLLWAVAVVALPIAGLVSFSTADDLVLFNDGPWHEEIEAPPIQEPQVNPYAVIMEEHDLPPGPWMLAINARLTYPLVPASPWGSAMKGTLEALTLANPQATTRDRIDEHYLAYMAAHRRLHPEEP